VPDPGPGAAGPCGRSRAGRAARAAVSSAAASGCRCGAAFDRIISTRGPPPRPVPGPSTTCNFPNLGSHAAPLRRPPSEHSQATGAPGMSTLSYPPHRPSNIKRAAILFSGGPAPAANAVISTAAVSFLRNGIEVYGILHGYSHLLEFAPDHPLQEGRDYLKVDHKLLKRTRNRRGIIIGSARANPGKKIRGPEDLTDPERSAP